jgi:hypothetical protein
MLAIVAPTSMTIDQQTVFLQGAMKALNSLNISAGEVEAVAPQVIAKIVRHQQIIHEISEAVSLRRQRKRVVSDADWRRDSQPLRKAPVMERRGEPMTAAETDELNRELARVGAFARYRMDGTRYHVTTGEELGRTRTAEAKRNEPLTKSELAGLRHDMVSLGLKHGFLKRVGGVLYEVTQ